MKINLIAATDLNGVIGVNGKIPWHIPEDLKRFKRITMGHPVLMGRKTWASLLPMQSLPGRLNVVISDSLVGCDIPGDIIACGSLIDAVHAVRNKGYSELFVIGGSRLYREALPFASRVYLTTVDMAVDISSDVPVAHFPLMELNASTLKPVLTGRANGYQFDVWE